ncbi:Cation/H(+) antiporter 15 [Platanthera zijinensis]|uniref:Cation/H(+) antiporter 15 n=1 Tax=Platanthera zijinensis TaxID=2320716 RepID=A0AAP0C5J2_9ASPA
MAPSLHHANSALNNIHASASTAVNASIDDMVCFAPNMITTNGFWEGVNPLRYAFPIFVLQLIIVVLTTRLLVIILRPLRQPRVIAEIIGGVLLGKSVMGQLKGFGATFFPQQSLLVLATVANLGLILFIFLVGVEMDPAIFRRMGRRALVIALAGMSLPFGIGSATSFLFRHHISDDVREAPFLLFMGVTLSVTAFPVLARILAETKLLNTELGRTAMSAAIVNDLCAWILLAISLSLADSQGSPLVSIWMIAAAAGFVLFCFYVVRPALRWMERRAAAKGADGVTDFQLCAIMAGLMLAALATDAIGVHVVFGAFVYGLVVPSGAMGKAVVEKLEDFVTGVMLPLFFVMSGLRTNLRSMKDPVTAVLLLLVFLIASMTKIVGTVLVSAFYGMPFRDGLALGFLMNTRGLVEMIVLNIGSDRQVLDDEAFAMMVVSSVIMTSTVLPVVTSIYRPSRRLIGYKRRTIQRTKPDAELRMLACFHSPRQISPILSLLSLSNPTKRSPVFLYALHLVELTGRASTLIAAASACTSPTSTHPSAPQYSFVSPSPFISIHLLSAASPFITMHHDVSRIAEEKHAALILLPFHKHLAVDGTLEAASNPGLRTLNINLLSSAPCSVALLVDRGLASIASRRIAILFLGGPHDREALAFAWRMADDHLASVSLIRYLPLTDPRMLSIVTDGGSAAGGGDEAEERRADEEIIATFRLKHAGNDRVVYREMAVTSGEEVVAAVRGIESVYDLYVVGRGHGGAAAGLTAGLTEWADCPELGPIGDLLASSDVAASASVLVVQQYVGGPLGQAAPASPRPLGRRNPAESGGIWGRMSSFEIGRPGR